MYRTSAIPNKTTIHPDDNADLVVAFLRDRLGHHVRFDRPKRGREDTLIYGAIEVPDDYFELDELRPAGEEVPQ